MGSSPSLCFLIYEMKSTLSLSLSHRVDLRINRGNLGKIIDPLIIILGPLHTCIYYTTLTLFYISISKGTVTLKTMSMADECLLNLKVNYSALCCFFYLSRELLVNFSIIISCAI